MRARVGVVLCLLVVGLVALTVVEPRLHHTFPSMVDDWSAILKAPDQLRGVLRLENPEEQRYRPGFIAWNTLQWHTLGAPHSFAGPQLWGLLRIAVLVLGLTLLTRLLVQPSTERGPGLDPRWLLVAGVPLAIVSIPGIAVDLARFGPQEVLMVGCMSLGAVVLVSAFDRFLDAGRLAAAAAMSAALGLVAWWSGVLQKETSICVLVVAPFLWPTIRGQAARWRSVETKRRVAIGTVAAATLLPFVPMVARTVQLATAESRVYEDAAAQADLGKRVADQLTRAWDWLHTPLFGVLALAATGAIAVRAVRRDVDWITVGLVVAGLGFVAFAAESGVVASRYYLPPATLFALALARTIAPLGARAALGTGVALMATALIQMPIARQQVEMWVNDERDQEALVRASAARVAAGCAVDVTGRNIELVMAHPVLVPLADVTPAADCHEGDRFVTVIDWISSTTPPDDPVLASCGSAPTLVWQNRIGTIVRCDT